MLFVVALLFLNIITNSASVPEIGTSNCGNGKGCFRNPPGCTEDTCQALVTWQTIPRIPDGLVRFELSADANGWVAVGFSDDQKMGKDGVLECIRNVSELQYSFNEEQGKKNTVHEVKFNTTTHFQWSHINGRLRCSFEVPKLITPVGAAKLDLGVGQGYYLLLGWGNTTEQGKKLLHPLEPFKFPYVSTRRVAMIESANLDGTARYSLVKAHGILMLIAWIMSASTAILLARYYKKQWSDDDRICGVKKWFALHRGFQLGNLILTIIAFVLIFVHAGGYSQMPDLPAKAHPILGIVVTVLCILNPLIAICRCSENSQYRPVFNWFHWFFGTIAHILSVPTIFIGMNLPKAFVPSWVTWILVIFMLFHLIIELLLEIHGCRNNPKQKMRDEKSYQQMGSKAGKPVGYRFRRNILIVYLIVTAILGTIMVIGIAIG